MIAPMSPTCFAKPSTKPFSVVVLVSAEEFANMLSNFAPICCACDGVGNLHDVPPDQPLTAAARFSSR